MRPLKALSAKVQREGEAPAKLTRAERNDDVKRRLFEAAAKVVGQYGYAEASIARITDLAGFAQGTFYNHFQSRQELLDQLLPAMGQRMIAFIRERVDAAANESEREEARFKAFFDFLLEVPEFLRILNEAEFFAPSGYRAHFDNIASNYVHILKRSRGRNQVADFSDDELEVIVHILMGARGYLGQRFAYRDGSVGAVPPHVTSAYTKLLRHGLFSSKRK